MRESGPIHDAQEKDSYVLMKMGAGNIMRVSLSLLASSGENGQLLCVCRIRSGLSRASYT
jgi:hypothetical protein